MREYSHKGESDCWDDYLHTDSTRLGLELRPTSCELTGGMERSRRSKDAVENCEHQCGR